MELYIRVLKLFFLNGGMESVGELVLGLGDCDLLFVIFCLMRWVFFWLLWKGVRFGMLRSFLFMEDLSFCCYCVGVGI